MEKVNTSRVTRPPRKRFCTWRCTRNARPRKASSPALHALRRGVLPARLHRHCTADHRVLRHAHPRAGAHSVLPARRPRARRSGAREGEEATPCCSRTTARSSPGNRSRMRWSTPRSWKRRPSSIYSSKGGAVPRRDADRRPGKAFPELKGPHVRRPRRLQGQARAPEGFHAAHARECARSRETRPGCRQFDVCVDPADRTKCSSTRCMTTARLSMRTSPLHSSSSIRRWRPWSRRRRCACSSGFKGGSREFS